MYSNGISEVKGTVGQMKKSGTLWIVILGAVIGLGLLLLGSFDWPFGKSGEKESAASNNEYAQLQAYKQEVSGEVARLCARVRGVGEVQVIVTLSGGYEYVYARDVQNKTGKDSNVWEESYVLIGSGNAQTPVLLRRLQPEIAGVGIVCQGGNDPAVQNELIALVSAAFGIGTNKIHVSASQNE